jgi:hypothetical protein
MEVRGMSHLFDVSPWIDLVFPLSIAILAAATLKAFALAGARNAAADSRRPKGGRQQHARGI